MKNQRYKNIKIFLNYVLGPLLFAWLSYSIYQQIKNQPDLLQTWEKIRASFGSPMIIYLFLVFLLMLINWSLEALKWKLSVQQVQPVSFFKALKAIFSGISFSVTTPNRMGEYLGRVLYMNEGNRIRVISLTILGSISQMMITLVFGLAGLIILKPNILNSSLSAWPAWINIVLMLGGIVFCFLTVFYFRLSWLIKWIDKLPWMKKYSWLINELERIDATLLIRLLSLSALRYGVFALQYFLLFHFFDVGVNWWQGFWSIAVVFFIMAVLPTIALFEIVQKVYVSREIFSIFTANTLGIGLATTGIWFINLVIPAAAGSLFILGVKIFKKKNEVS